MRWAFARSSGLLCVFEGTEDESGNLDATATVAYVWLPEEAKLDFTCIKHCAVADSWRTALVAAEFESDTTVFSSLFYIDFATACPVATPNDADIAADIAAILSSGASDEVVVYSCAAQQVDAERIAGVLGTTINHVAFLPDSDSTFACLLNGVQLKIYDRAELTAAQQTFYLGVGAGRGSFGAGSLSLDYVRLGFSRLLGWEAYAVYLLRSDGALFRVCPVLPAGALLSPREVHHLMQRYSAEEAARLHSAREASGPNALAQEAELQAGCLRAWLRAALRRQPLEPWAGGGGLLAGQRRDLGPGGPADCVFKARLPGADVAPALVGPLNALGAAAGSGARAVDLAAMSFLPPAPADPSQDAPGQASPPPPGLAAFMQLSSDQQLRLHALASPALPVFTRRATDL